MVSIFSLHFKLLEQMLCELGSVSLFFNICPDLATFHYPHLNQVVELTITVHFSYYLGILLAGLTRFLVSLEKSEDFYEKPGPAVS